MLTIAFLLQYMYCHQYESTDGSVM